MNVYILFRSAAVWFVSHDPNKCIDWANQDAEASGNTKPEWRRVGENQMEGYNSGDTYFIECHGLDGVVVEEMFPRI